MTIQVGVGISQHRNPVQAGKDAARAALAQAGLDGCDFVYVFSTTGYDQNAVLRAVREVTGKPVPVKVGPRRPGDPPALVASCEKAAAELGWRAKYTDLRRTIETAWQWHRTHPRGYDD